MTRRISSSSSSSIAPQAGTSPEANGQARSISRIWTRITSAVRTNRAGRSNGTNDRRQEAVPARNEETGNHGKRAWIQRNAGNVTTHARTLVGNLLHGRQLPPETNTASQPAPEPPPKRPLYRANYGERRVPGAGIQQTQTFIPPKKLSESEIQRWRKEDTEMLKIWAKGSQLQKTQKPSEKSAIQKVHELEMQIQAEELRYLKKAFIHHQNQTQDTHSTSSVRPSDVTAPSMKVPKKSVLAPEPSSGWNPSGETMPQDVRSVEKSTHASASVPNELDRPMPEKSLSPVGDNDGPRIASDGSGQEAMGSPKNTNSTEQQTHHGSVPLEQAPSQSVSSVGVAASSPVRENEGPIETHTAEEQLQIARNRELEVELMQLRAEFAAHEAAMQTTPTSLPDPPTNIGSFSASAPSVQSSLRNFQWSRPLQTIPSDGTPPQLAVPVPNSLPYSFETAAKPYIDRFSSNAGGLSRSTPDAAVSMMEEPLPPAGNLAMVTTTEGVHGPHQMKDPALEVVVEFRTHPSSMATPSSDVMPLQSIQSMPMPSEQISGDPSKPTLPYMEEMSSVQQRSMLQDFQSFRRGYYGGVALAAGNQFVQAHRAENTTVAKEFSDVQNFLGTLYSHPNTASMQASGSLEEPQAFVHGHEYGLAVGRLHMPPHDTMPKFSEITQMFHANWNHQIAQAQQAQPGIAPPTSSGTGAMSVAASSDNPIVVLQVPPIDVPIVSAPNVLAAQAGQSPVQGAQVQDPRIPPGIVVSSSFQQPSVAAAGAETTSSNGVRVEYF